MTRTTKLRIICGLILLFNLWLIGNYNIQGLPVFILTFGFAVVFEMLITRKFKNKE
ncbi:MULTISPECIES: hypothetical protein [unclassified Acinetobacter]|uniref:hypothetical protein n=1 Tax=unclassified Acinetobacter TaxID=196816 RepID=UPI0025751C1C|nr:MULTISPECIES: hypothetical protein [unclassified Acinetobacter]MDM1757179.1 hypothetical protein [Acinetobacter sp. 256-1]MDM1760036.1 hypothetical protein [Acinetobacter sp. 251-1]